MIVPVPGVAALPSSTRPLMVIRPLLSSTLLLARTSAPVAMVSALAPVSIVADVPPLTSPLMANARLSVKLKPAAVKPPRIGTELPALVNVTKPPASPDNMPVMASEPVWLIVPRLCRIRVPVRLLVPMVSELARAVPPKPPSSIVPAVMAAVALPTPVLNTIAMFERGLMATRPVPALIRSAAGLAGRVNVSAISAMVPDGAAMVLDAVPVMLMTSAVSEIVWLLLTAETGPPTMRVPVFTTVMSPVEAVSAPNAPMVLVLPSTNEAALPKMVPTLSPPPDCVTALLANRPSFVAPTFATLAPAKSILPAVVAPAESSRPNNTVGAAMWERLMPPAPPTSIAEPAVIGAIETVPPRLLMVPGTVTVSAASLTRPPPTVLATESAPLTSIEREVSKMFLSAPALTVPVTARVDALPALTVTLPKAEASAPSPVRELPAWFNEISPPAEPVSALAVSAPADWLMVPALLAVDASSRNVPAVVAALPVRLMALAVIRLSDELPMRTVLALIRERSPSTMPVPDVVPMRTTAAVRGPISTVPPVAVSAPAPVKLNVSVAMLIVLAPVATVPATKSAPLSTSLMLPVAESPAAPTLPITLPAWLRSIVVPALPISVPTFSAPAWVMAFELSSRSVFALPVRSSAARAMFDAVVLPPLTAPRCKTSVLTALSSAVGSGPATPEVRLAAVNDAISVRPVWLALMLASAVVILSACSASVPPVVTPS